MHVRHAVRLLQVEQGAKQPSHFIVPLLANVPVGQAAAARQVLLYKYGVADVVSQVEQFVGPSRHVLHAVVLHATHAPFNGNWSVGQVFEHVLLFEK